MADGSNQITGAPMSGVPMIDPGLHSARTGGAIDGAGHHYADGRNVAREGRGLGGKDVFFAAVQMTRMPMCMSDPNQPDMPIVFVNEAFQRMTGYAETEIIGRNCRFLQGPDTDPATIEIIRQAVAAREDCAVEVLNYRRDGTPFWNALYLSPVFDGEGSLIYFFASQLDVTRRKEAEDIMQQSQRMEALGSMACGVAHEFNNLLTIVMGSTQMAATRAVDDRQRDHLGRVEWAARQAGRLTHQMLSFARRQFHDLQPLELNHVVRETDSLLAQVVGSNVALSFELSPDALPVTLDPGQLELALINLARNAVDAMPDGGRLVIGTAPYPADSASRFVSLSVSDTGEGMSAETVRRATEPFFTTKARGKGTGLGLSMVAGFAEQSGGRLEVSSRPDAGTRITIVLPRREE